MSNAGNLTTPASDREIGSDNGARLTESGSRIEQRLTEIVQLLRELFTAMTGLATDARRQDEGNVSTNLGGRGVVDAATQPGGVASAAAGLGAVKSGLNNPFAERNGVASGAAVGREVAAAGVPGAGLTSDVPSTIALATAITQQSGQISEWSRQHNAALRNAVAAVETSVRELAAMQQATASLSESLNQLQQSLVATGERSRAQRLAGR